ncbi:phosphate acyltransferase [Jannaschia aquimarina]|uniref:Pta protein n=1 Tax=Jannaschia aquimarina TaxID=935700 RepID=A0A0D1EEA4_9RHOB|nr:phosphate acyltransferase [Jannaschia aquimarina]KIT16029.1 Phosphate acetyltransferase [Jannaschia aquimarina]SNT00464.1 phosphate acetyltransferase [Jannaschia aquimarina]
MTHPFLSPTPPETPGALLARARDLPVPRVALVNAGSATALAGLREMAAAGLATPILIGDPAKIRDAATQIDWDISDLPLIDAPREAASVAAAELARDSGADAIMKGQVHTSTFLKGLLPSRAGLRAPGARCGHVFHITLPGDDRPLFLTDAALNVAPDVETRKACLAHAVRLAQLVGIERPRAAMLGATEDPIASIPNTLESQDIADWAKDALPQADVAGPIAMDLALSAEAARIKGYENPVAGAADIMVAPAITTGNVLFKTLAFGMGACAGGVVMGAKVPFLLTSRAQKTPARLASAALGMIVAADAARTAPAAQ